VFSGATSFNQDMSNWGIIDKFKMLDGLFDRIAISVQNYDAILASWVSSIPVKVNNTRQIEAVGLTYCLSNSVRSEMSSKWYFPYRDSLKC
jgi:hypothetical protein